MSLFNAIPTFPALHTPPAFFASEAEWEGYFADPSVKAWDNLRETVKDSIELSGTFTASATVAKRALGVNRVALGELVKVIASRVQDDNEDYEVKPIFRTIIRQAGRIAYVAEYDTEEEQEKRLNAIINAID